MQLLCISILSTPLIVAGEIGNVEISELLLQKGAMIDMRGRQGRQVVLDYIF